MTLTTTPDKNTITNTITNAISIDQKDITEIGYAISVNSYIVWLNGLPNVKMNELVISESKARGIVTTLKDTSVEVLMLDDAKIQPKEKFFRTNIPFSINTGIHLLGRTINPLGQPLDGKGGLNKSGDLAQIDTSPPGIRTRELIKRQFETGIAMVDMLVPIAYGQRELIIGDPHSGKSSFLIDTVINQKGKNIICVFALLGKPIDEIKSIVEVLKANEALAYTIVVTASSSDKPTLIYLAPSTAVAIAQYFQKQGKDVLLIMDDLGLHAKFYREISLLSGKAPGRQSYPGDIFFEHAKLVEKCGQFNPEYGGGSITALPVIEANTDDFASYLTTNLMGMTDGHLLFSSAKYHQGIKPSIDVSLSVSRVGRQTQSMAQKSLADKLKALLAESNRLETYARLGSDISPHTQLVIKQGKQIESLLRQSALSKIPIIVQMIMLGLVFTTFFNNKDVAFVDRNKKIIVNYLLGQNSQNQPPFDITKYEIFVNKLSDDKQFIESLTNLIPVLDRICK